MYICVFQVSNGATFVSVDKVTNTPDNTPALQVHGKLFYSSYLNTVIIPRKLLLQYTEKRFCGKSFSIADLLSCR